MVLTSSCTLSMLVRFAVSSEQRVKYNTYMYQVTHTCTYVRIYTTCTAQNYTKLKRFVVWPSSALYIGLSYLNPLHTHALLSGE